MIVLDSGCRDPQIEIVRFCSVPGLDPTGHGSGVVRLIQRLAPRARIAVGRLLGGTGHAMPRVLDWVIDQAPDVLVCSWAARDVPDRWDERFGEILAGGMLCVAAHNPHLRWPHSRPDVLACGRIDRDTKPPCDLLTRIPNDSPIAGTSAACAWIGGAAACWRSANPAGAMREFLAATAAAGPDRVSTTKRGAGRPSRSCDGSTGNQHTPRRG